MAPIMRTILLATIAILCAAPAHAALNPVVPRLAEAIGAWAIFSSHLQACEQGDAGACANAQQDLLGVPPGLIAQNTVIGWINQIEAYTPAPKSDYLFEHYVGCTPGLLPCARCGNFPAMPQLDGYCISVGGTSAFKAQSQYFFNEVCVAVTPAGC